MCVCVYVCVCVCVCVYTHVHTYTHTYTHIGGYKKHPEMLEPMLEMTEWSIKYLQDAGFTLVTPIMYVCMYVHVYVCIFIRMPQCARTLGQRCTPPRHCRRIAF